MIRPQHKFTVWRKHYMTGAIMNASALLLRQGYQSATGVLCFMMISKTYLLSNPHGCNEDSVIICQHRWQRWPNAGLCARLPGGIPSLAVAVRCPAPPLRESAGADRGHGLHRRRVRRLLQNRFLISLSPSFKINRDHAAEPNGRHYSTPFVVVRPSNKGTKLPISDNLAPETVRVAVRPCPSVRPSARGLYFICERTDDRRRIEENTRGNEGAREAGGGREERVEFLLVLFDRWEWASGVRTGGRKEGRKEAQFWELATDDTILISADFSK